MGHVGFEERRRQGEERVRRLIRSEAGNARLEGPGSEERLSRLRTRFRALNNRLASVRRSSALATGVLTCVVFLVLFSFTLWLLR